MKIYALPLVAMLCIFLLSSCSGDKEELTYKYCIYSAEKLCAEGPFTTCQEKGKLSNACPYGSDSSPSGISSSRVVPGSSSATLAVSSSSIQSGISSSSLVPSSSSSVASVGGSCDIKDYRTVKIGTQTWIAQNLNCDVAGSVCYNNDSTYCTKYGRLYEWEAAMKACPSGWHLSSNDDWEVLVKFAGGAMFAGAKLKAVDGWEWYELSDKSGGGTDDYGFAALPGGGGDGMGGFGGADRYGYWWSSSETKDGKKNTYSWMMDFSLDHVIDNATRKSGVCTVRCVKD